ncbi:sugar ABC transporter permease [Streptomyces sp. NPDC052225]|uniref:carbohydrate ABC transporter permease n=1 Tax=Streptomyces sp. NPDC052225 TaxID=3154949 RepID=UPI0034499096
MSADTAVRPAATGRRAPRQVGRLPRAAVHHPWWFALPAVLFFLAFFLLPNLLNFYYPFTNWSSYHADIAFTGLDNVRTVLDDGSLVRALRTTLIYAALAALFQNAFGLGLALLLERDTRFNRFFRAVFFLPVLISALAVGYVFQALFDQDGAVNSLAGLDIPWLGSTTWTLVLVSAVHGWKWMGLSMLIYLAGLKGIPGDMLEAARMDGAGPWRTFRSVRWPMLAPAVTFNVTTALIGSMNTFDIVQATTGGGPAASTEVFNLYMFRVFGQGLYAQASTMSLVLFLVVVAIAIPLVVGLRRREQLL